MTDQQSFDEDWVLNPKNTFIDLNPYFIHEEGGAALLFEQRKEMIIQSQAQKSKNRSAYETFYKDFFDIMEKSDSRNGNVMAVIKSKPTEMKIEVLRDMSKKSNPELESSIASFPNVEKYPNRKRLSLPLSPSS